MTKSGTRCFYYGTKTHERRSIGKGERKIAWETKGNAGVSASEH